MLYIMECEFCGGRTFFDGLDMSAVDVCPYCGVKQYRSSVESETIHLYDKVIEQHNKNIFHVPSFEETEHKQKSILYRQRFMQLYPNEDTVYVHKCRDCDWELVTTKIKYVQFCPKCKLQWLDSILEQFQFGE